ncbi:MAG: hypothetical protein ACHP6I_01050 [Rickettsiales bacterium]
MQNPLAHLSPNQSAVIAQPVVNVAKEEVQTTNSVFKTQQQKDLQIKDEQLVYAKRQRRKSRGRLDDDFESYIAFSLQPLVDPINLYLIQQFLQSKELTLQMVTKLYQKFAV